MGARERTYGCSPKPQVVRGEPVGVLSQQASLYSRGVFKRGDWIETELNDPGIGARQGSNKEVFSF